MWKKSTLRDVLMPLIIVAGTSGDAAAAGPVLMPLIIVAGTSGDAAAAGPVLDANGKAFLQGVDDHLEFRQLPQAFTRYHQPNLTPAMAEARAEGELCAINQLRKKMDFFAKSYGYRKSDAPYQTYTSSDQFFASSFAQDLQSLIFDNPQAYDKINVAAAWQCVNNTMPKANWPTLPEANELYQFCSSLPPFSRLSC